MVGNGGLLTASGTTFNGSRHGDTTQIVVDSGGQLQASNSTFALSQRQPEHRQRPQRRRPDRQQLRPARCILPEVDVQYLSGTGSNNAQFQDIDILAGSLASGQTLALNAIGTRLTANLRYVFPGNFTVDSGATCHGGRQRQRR